jgi:hypothetical protein
MPYLEDVKEFFDTQVRELFIENQNPFQNGFETSIFYLISRLLNKEANGAYFINIPMRELGTERAPGNNHEINYSGFCNSVLLAAGIKVFDLNKGNTIPENNEGDYIFVNNEIFITKKNGFAVIRNKKRRPNQIAGNYPLLLNDGEYSYNTRNNAELIISNYFCWLKSFKRDTKILNNINNKILIISHSEISKASFFKSIPICTITEDGCKTYSSPLEPFIYLSRSSTITELEEMVRTNFFSTIIFLGDRKFDGNDVWDIDNQYFDKIIFIGANAPTNQIKNYYVYSRSEMHRYYKTPTIEYVNKILVNEELDDAVQKFNEIVKEISTNGGSLKFSPLIIYNITTPVDDVDKDYKMEWFEHVLNDNLVNGGENSYENLTIAFENILIKLKNGNQSKLTYFQNLRDEHTLKNEDKKLFYIVENRNELLFLKNNYKINEKNIFTKSSYFTKIKGIKNRTRNKFVFFTFGRFSLEILKVMDQLSIIGDRIFISYGNKDLRFNSIQEELNKYENSSLSHSSREDVTAIKYEKSKPIGEEIEVKESTLDDYNYNDNDVTSFSRPVKIERFRVEFDKGESVTLDGSVIVDYALKDAADIEKNDEIKYYQNDPELFENAWMEFAKDMAANIDYFSRLWKITLSELKSYYRRKDNVLFKALTNFGWKTEITSLKAYLREGNDIQFPRPTSLIALKKLCESLDQFNNCDFIANYSDLRKAQSANEDRKKLGRILSNALLQDAIGNTSDESFIKKISTTGIFNQLKDKCIHSGTVKNSTKI